MDWRLITPAIARPHGGQCQNAHKEYEEASRSGLHTFPLMFRRQLVRMPRSPHAADIEAKGIAPITSRIAYQAD
jgi:hypothetical protein